MDRTADQVTAISVPSAEEPVTPVLGRYPTGSDIPGPWRNIGGPPRRRGRIYRPRPGRRRILRVLLIVGLSIVGIVVPIAAALLRMLVL